MQIWLNWEYIVKKKDARVILPEAMIAEIEHQANEGRSIGFTALEEGEKYIENGFPI